MFACMECGKIFRDIKKAERAASVGCPRCGSVDIDIHLDTPSTPSDSNQPVEGVIK